MLKISIVIHLQKKVRDRKGNPLPSRPVASDLDVASEQIQNLIPSQPHIDPCKGSFFIFYLSLNATFTHIHVSLVFLCIPPYSS